jgi:hypothetical protein
VTDTDNREALKYDGSTGAILRWFAYGLGANEVLNSMDVAANQRDTLIPDIQGSIIASSNGLGQSPNGPIGRMVMALLRQLWPGTQDSASMRKQAFTIAQGTIRRNPLGYETSPNLYAYVLNDPLNATAPATVVHSTLPSSLRHSVAPVPVTNNGQP